MTPKSKLSDAGSLDMPKSGYKLYDRYACIGKNIIYIELNTIRGLRPSLGSF